MSEREQWPPTDGWARGGAGRSPYGPPEARGPGGGRMAFDRPRGPNDFVAVPWAGRDGDSLEAESGWGADEAEGGEVVLLPDAGGFAPDPEAEDGDGEEWPAGASERAPAPLLRAPPSGAEREWEELDEWSGQGDAPLQLLLAEDAPELRVEVSPTPKISDVVAAFPATLLARGSAEVAIEKMLWELNKGLNAKGSNWIKRVWASWDTLRKEFPRVPVTIELIRLDDLALTRQGARSYEAGTRLREYVAKRHLTRGAFAWSHTANEAYLFKQQLEQQLGITLDALFDRSSTPLPSKMTPDQKVRHLLLIQADFSGLRKYIVSDEVAVLDEFAFNKATLTDVHKQKIAAIVRHLDASWTSGDIEHAAVLLVGHTDNRGGELYNVDLGARRATAVAEALAEGVAAVRLGSKFTFPTKSLGEVQPVVANPATPAQHARNRRVEVFLPPPKRRTWPQADLPKSLDEVIGRGRKLLEQTRDKLDPLGISVYQTRRLYCVLRKLADARMDDAYIDGYAATSDPAVRKGPPINVQLHIQRARQTLVGSGFYGAGATDADFLRALGWLDRAIWAGPHIFGAEVAQHGIATKTGVVQLSEWIGQRQRDPKSIYHCYHPDNW